MQRTDFRGVFGAVFLLQRPAIGLLAGLPGLAQPPRDVFTAILAKLVQGLSPLMIEIRDRLVP
ncbi:MAG: hypothetical protein AAGC79_18330, partial [Pseudomonadota bacterium]